MSKLRVTMYTDGACKGNPGPGGWGVLLKWGDHQKELFGGEQQTTNNRMELMAAIKGLEALNRACEVNLYTDSTYLKQGMTQWLEAWKKRGWKTADKKEVKNRDLWQQLDELAAQHEIAWHWVKAHAGIPDNERADQLANMGIGENGA